LPPGLNGCASGHPQGRPGTFETWVFTAVFL
jgi:hypothetical protein